MLPKTSIEDKVQRIEYHYINSNHSRIPAEVASVYTNNFVLMFPDGSLKLLNESPNITIQKSLIFSEPIFVLTKDGEIINLLGMVGRINFNTWMLVLFSLIPLLLYFRIRALEHFYAVYLILLAVLSYQVAAYRSFYIIFIIISMFILGIVLSSELKSKKNGVGYK